MQGFIIPQRRLSTVHPIYYSPARGGCGSSHCFACGCGAGAGWEILCAGNWVLT